MIELHADPDGYIKAIDAEGSHPVARPAEAGAADVAASPLFLIIPPAKVAEFQKTDTA